MVAIGMRAGVVVLPPGQGFAPQTGRQIGNQLPPGTGAWQPDPFPPGPSPHRKPGYVIDGQLGSNDGTWGSDPRAAPIQPFPRRVSPVIEGQVDGAEGGPLSYGGGIGRDPSGTVSDGGWAARLGPSGYPLAEGRESYWRGGIQGFNDQLRVVDRHGYWDAGSQRTGVTFDPATAAPNAYNDPAQTPPRADLRLVNRSVTYQKGTDVTRNADDLSRPYTWVGEQGSGWSPVYGGVPGLYHPYGSRGGVPYATVDPTEGEGGREVVWSGPPHGLHSATFPDNLDTIRRFVQLPQMRPVRVDRPSNSPQAGQAFSQTVQRQGGPPTAPGRPSSPIATPIVPVTGRGWTGQRPWT